MMLVWLFEILPPRGRKVLVIVIYALAGALLIGDIVYGTPTTTAAYLWAFIIVVALGFTMHINLHVGYIGEATSPARERATMVCMAVAALAIIGFMKDVIFQ